MISGIAKLKNWAKIAEKVTNTRANGTVISGEEPTLIEPTTKAVTIARITQNRMPPAFASLRTEIMPFPSLTAMRLANAVRRQ